MKNERILIIKLSGNQKLQLRFDDNRDSWKQEFIHPIIRHMKVKPWDVTYDFNLT